MVIPQMTTGSELELLMPLCDFYKQALHMIQLAVVVILSYYIL